MKADVLLGLQWGDEGKGKVVDVLTAKYDLICRFQGGPNAGHTLEFDNQKYVLHSIPSGIFHENTINIIGNGVVIEPAIFKKEVNALSDKTCALSSNLKISKKAHIILPSHKILDAASEAAKGKTKIGSTLKGIGPTYMDKTGRNGLRIGDIVRHDFKEKYKLLVEKHKKLLAMYDFDYELKELEKEFFEGIDTLKQFELIDSEEYINRQLSAGKKILAEGAQGTLLDIDFGTYPFVTSSNTVCAGACIGLGIAPNKIGNVTGIFKAYTTRVGAGPFPTELFDKTGKALQKYGHEFGATTGRARRCGWLDMNVLKYSVMLNGVSELVMTKADVLSEFDTIKIATHYRTKEKEYTYLPYTLDEDLEPVYKEFKGWKKDISKCRTSSELPKELMEFVDFIETETGVPVKMISVGPDREARIFR